MVFQAAGGQEIYLHRVILFLGLGSGALALATFAYCRSCLAFFRIPGRNPMETRAYPSFFRQHASYWWAFGVLMVAHIMTAISHTGLPAAGDPDAYIHQIVLLLGIAIAVCALAMFSTCRVFPRLLAPLTPRSGAASRLYQLLYGGHSYLWLAFSMLVAGHMAVGIIHAGL